METGDCRLYLSEGTWRPHFHSKKGLPPLRSENRGPELAERGVVHGEGHSVQGQLFCRLQR
ncbi:MAG: hypothetical protein JWM54_2160 [Acidobacteriaceae bacterium]|nr:hypothetical protein [Acidobacteriaceae bacterium]